MAGKDGKAAKEAAKAEKKRKAAEKKQLAAEKKAAAAEKKLQTRTLKKQGKKGQKQTELSDENKSKLKTAFNDSQQDRVSGTHAHVHVIAVRCPLSAVRCPLSAVRCPLPHPAALAFATLLPLYHAPRCIQWGMAEWNGMVRRATQWLTRADSIN